jgi:peptide/nickel transport system substrate-binding protein
VTNDSQESRARLDDGARVFTRREVVRGGVIGAGALSLGGVLAAAASSSAAAALTPAASVRRGGTLTVAYVGGGTSETINPTLAVADIDDARAGVLFDPFVRFLPNQELGYVLAESLEPNAKATAWTMRIREGVQWHDGSPLTPEDVMFTFRQFAQKTSTNPLATNFMDLAGMKKLDSHTVLLPLTTPNADFPNFLQLIYALKNGETKYTHPIGTGPFEFVSFTPGQQSVFKANPHYWQAGKPYVDELKMVSIPDQTARLNALLGGEIDAMESLDYAQAKEYESSGQIALLRANGANYVPIYMATTLAPFTDVRVRQAMRLIANRPELITEAQLGFGQVGNDLFGQGHPFYDTTLAQRHQDIEQAKSLLKAAGKSDLKVTLYSSTVAAGMLESATVFAAQAAQAGITVNVQNVPGSAYFGPDYLKQSFAQSLWFAYDSVFSQMARSVAPNAPFNETHWNDPKWTALYTQALGTVDAAKRKQLGYELQSILWNQGGYIYWGDFPLIDGLSTKVRGAQADSGGPLGNGDWQDWWLAA